MSSDRPDRCAPTAAAGEHRAHVARPCGTSSGRARRSRRRAPDPPRRRPGDARTHGQQRRPGPGRSGRGQRRDSSPPVPPSCETPITSAGRRRVQGQLEGLGGDRAAVRAGRPLAPPPAGSRRPRAPRARRCRSRSRRSAPRPGRPSRTASASAAAGPPAAHVAGQDPSGDRRLGRDHVGQVVRRPGPQARLVACRPTGRAGRAGARAGRRGASGVRHRLRIGGRRRPVRSAVSLRTVTIGAVTVTTRRFGCRSG